MSQTTPHSGSWTFIGAGNMASSLIGGLIAGGQPPETITAIDVSDAARERAADRFGLITASELTHLPENGSLVVAVKPDGVENVCRLITALAPAGVAAPLVVSVAAGVRSDSMASWLPDNTPIVRCMPNTPALLGLGATAMYANTRCNTAQRRVAQALLDAAGTSIWVSEEAALDAVTAVSGSGPAYFFYLIEHMTKSGIALGLSAEDAETLAIETAHGAACMARLRDTPAAQLRANVTSKGGTTAAAINSFDADGMPATIENGMRAAHARAVELGDQFDSAE